MRDHRQLYYAMVGALALLAALGVLLLATQPALPAPFRVIVTGIAALAGTWALLALIAGGIDR